jgi:hypothetical protein
VYPDRAVALAQHPAGLSRLIDPRNSYVARCRDHRIAARLRGSDVALQRRFRSIPPEVRGCRPGAEPLSEDERRVLRDCSARSFCDPECRKLTLNGGAGTKA